MWGRRPRLHLPQALLLTVSLVEAVGLKNARVLQSLGQPIVCHACQKFLNVLRLQDASLEDVLPRRPWQRDKRTPTGVQRGPRVLALGRTAGNRGRPPPAAEPASSSIRFLGGSTVLAGDSGVNAAASGGTGGRTTAPRAKSTRSGAATGAGGLCGRVQRQLVLRGGVRVDVQLLVGAAALSRVRFPNRPQARGRAACRHGASAQGAARDSPGRALRAGRCPPWAHPGGAVPGCRAGASFASRPLLVPTPVFGVKAHLWKRINDFKSLFILERGACGRVLGVTRSRGARSLTK